jgi:hypothetical protein
VSVSVPVCCACVRVCRCVCVSVSVSVSVSGRLINTHRYVDKAPRTPGGKLTMLGHGFYMLIMISSYVANLASVLRQRDNSMDFSGWYEGNKPITARMEDVELSIPYGTSQTRFIRYEELAEGRKFARVDCYETWEESMDAVLCGEAPAAFHDEAMVLARVEQQAPMLVCTHRAASADACIRL